MAHTLAAAVHSELLIKKSRFLGCVQPVADRAAAQAIVAQLRAAHPGAAHVCWALLAGGQSAAVDDGEPSGTAGRPMLEVLRHQDFDGVLASVVRYYGGIQLGAGGLLRAYTDSIAQALREQGSSVGWLDPTVGEPPDFDERWAAVVMDDVHLYSTAQQAMAFNWFVNAISPAARPPAAPAPVT